MEECALARPGWSPDGGSASALAEFLILLNSPLGYNRIALLILQIGKRNLGTSGLLALYSFGLLVKWTSLYTLNDDLWIGYQTGCVGSLSTTTAILAASVVACLGHGIYRHLANRN